MKDFRLWQDKEAIAPGTLWESEIKAAVAQSVFFIPIITPTTVRSEYCRFEFDAFLAREQAYGRSDLIFPILYIRVPALEDSTLWQADPVLSIIARRQYVDWREFRHRDVYSTPVGEAIERLCSKIVEALSRPALSEAAIAQRRQEATVHQRQLDDEKQHLERVRQAEEAARLSEEKRRAEAAAGPAKAKREAEEAESRRQEEEQRRPKEPAPAAQTNGAADRQREGKDRLLERRRLDHTLAAAALVALTLAAAAVVVSRAGGAGVFVSLLAMAAAVAVWVAMMALTSASRSGPR